MNDSEAWPAVGAIYERIAITAVPWVEQFAPAVGAYRNVRWNQRTNLLPFVTGNDAKILIATDRDGDTRHIVDRHVRDPRQWRRFGRQVLNEILDGFRGALYFYCYSGRSIVNGAAKVPTNSKTINVRTKSNSLHNA